MATVKHVVTLGFLPEWVRILLAILGMAGFQTANALGYGMCDHSVFDRLWPGC